MIATSEGDFRSPWLRRGFAFAGFQDDGASARLRLRHGKTGEEVTLHLKRAGDGFELSGDVDMSVAARASIPVPFPSLAKPEDLSDAAVIAEPMPAAARCSAADQKPCRGIREAVDFLRSFLGSAERPVKRIREESERAGFRWRTVQAASSRIGVRRTKVGMRGGWIWMAPEDAQPQGLEHARRCTNMRG